MENKKPCIKCDIRNHRPLNDIIKRKSKYVFKFNVQKIPLWIKLSKSHKSPKDKSFSFTEKSANESQFCILFIR